MYRLIPGFPKYRVGRDGSVWSRWSGRWKRLRQFRLSAGYRAVDLSRPGENRKFYVHRLVLLAFVGECPEGMETLHVDGNPANNRLGNLRYGTAAENGQDRVRHGRVPRGEQQHNAKLTEADVRAARDMHIREGISVAVIARILGVRHETASRAISGETWQHLAA